MKVIRITGTGKVSVAPDTVELKMSFSQVYRDYEIALQQSAEQSQALAFALEDAGFARKDLKTTDFYVRAEYETYKDHKDEYKKRFTGYRFTHRMKLKFPNDNKKLGQVLYALAHCAVKTQFSFDYTVGDPEKVKEQLLENAMKDARHKADILTRAAGARLGELLHIDYSRKEISIYTHCLDDMEFSDAPLQENQDRSYAIDVEAENIELSDTVLAQWAIA